LEKKAVVKNRKESLKILSIASGTIINSSKDIVLLIDCKGNILEVNKSAMKFLKLKDQSDRPWVFYGCLNKSSKSFFKKNVDHSIKSGKQLKVEYADNNKYFEVSIYPVKVKNNPACAAIYISDISKRKKMELLLNESEAHYRKLYMETPSPYHSLDKNANIITVNPAWEKFLGYKKSEVLGKFFGDLVDIPVSLFKRNFAKFKEKGEVSNLEYRLIRKDGTIVHALFTGIVKYHKNGKFSHTHCVMSDITDRANMARERIRLQQAITQSHSPVVITDIEGNIEFVNPAFTRITGYSFNEVKGRNPRILKTELYDQAFYKKLWETILSGQTWKCEFFNRKKNGEKYWELASISPVYDQKKNLINFIKVSEDITRIKEIEQQLREEKQKAEQANLLKSTFLANMSHEIRTPMNGIVGFSELLARPNLSKEQKDKFVKVINDNCNSLLNLIDDIIDISKIEANQLNVNPVSAEILPLMRELAVLFEKILADKHKNHVKFITEIPDDFENLHIVTDPVRLKQIFTNLIGNSVKFTSAGYIKIGVERNAGQLAFFVEDTGIGISANKQKLIFEEFAQADKFISQKFGGTGLGLSISRGLIKNLGGNISVESSEGQGSRFVFTIPDITPDNPGVEKLLAQVNILGLKEKNILIVDPDEVNYLFLKYAFGETGFEITRVGGVLSVYRKIDTQRYDAVIISGELPDNLIELGNIIKKQNPGARIFVMSEQKPANLSIKFRGVNVAAYLKKPLDTKEISRFVKELG